MSLSTMANRNVSSAKNLMLFNMPSAVSLIYIKIKKGSSTDTGPCGIPDH